MVQLPKALGLMLCDQVIFEQGTQKPSLIGVFTRMAVDRFPSIPRAFDTFAVLTDGLGAAIIDLVGFDLQTDEQMYVQTAEIQFPDPLRVVNLRFRVRGCSFSVGGTYAFVLYADGAEIAERRLHVYLSEELQ